MKLVALKQYITSWPWSRKSQDSKVHLKNVWNLHKHESDETFVRVHNSVMANFRRDDMVKLKNEETGEVVFAPIRGCGKEYPKVFRQTLVMSYNLRARLGVGKPEEKANIVISNMTAFDRMRLNLMHPRSDISGAYQLGLISLAVSIGLAVYDKIIG